MKRFTVLVIILLIGVTGFVCAKKPFGVFANSNTNSIQFIDPAKGPWDPDAVSDSLLKGNLGSYGGGLFDLVITSDGKTAIVSNFGDSTIHFFDISEGFEEPPILLGSTYIGFFAEDMAITPNDKYVLVTDGGFSSRVAVVRINCRNNETVNLGGRQAQAVAITPDGTLALFADYWNGAIHSYTLDQDNGTLMFKETQIVLPGRPVNVAISPDGQTVIAVTVGYSTAPILLIKNNNLFFKEFIPMPSKNGQSCVFSKDGTKAYYLSNSFNKTCVHILNVGPPGNVSASGTSICLYPPRGSSQLFGVDTIALEPNGNYLYVANPTLSGGLTSVSVIDLTTNTEVGYIPANGIPTGIAFTTQESDDEE